MARDTIPDDAQTSDEQPPLTAAQAAGVAVECLAELTTKPLQGVTSVEPTDDGWLVEIEVLEDRRIPSSADIMATYQVEIDFDENLLAYRRTGRYHRGSTDIGPRGR
ncbi:gas vesicle protein [Nocardia africana]|uniref:Gas vesicle synthesis protein GvpO n=1 Tax=Nocardia africana TaxID=134964 RepID=A0A378X5M3_9NOCA|nr:gas vesicle protein [Nocardia africana]MCC3317105.1 gas vesicle protein [Nocardia africana]SUA47833.1 Gas vesicle synthesis protein GvpO [Nocardia africana]